MDIKLYAITFLSNMNASSITSYVFYHSLLFIQDQDVYCLIMLSPKIALCVGQQTRKNQNEDQCIQSCRTDHPPVWLRILGHLQEPLKTPRAIPSMLSPHYPKYTLEQLYHQPHSPGESRHHQHRGHVIEDPTMLGRAHVQDGRPLLAQDHFIWRTFFWPPKQRAPKKLYKDTLKKVPRCVQHQPS